MMLSVAQVAERCGVSQDVVRRSIRAGKLPAAKVFGRVRVDEADLLAYIESQRVGGGEVRRRRPLPPRPPVAGGLREVEQRRAA